MTLRKPAPWAWIASRTAQPTAAAKAAALYGFGEGGGDTKELVSGTTHPIGGSWATVDGLTAVNLSSGEAINVSPALGAYPENCSAVLVYASGAGPTAPGSAGTIYGEFGNGGNDYTAIYFINGFWDASDPGVMRVLFDIWAQDPLDGNNWQYFEAVGALPVNAFDGHPHVMRCDRTSELAGKIWFDGVDITISGLDPSMAGGQYSEAGDPFTPVGKASARFGAGGGDTYVGKLLGLGLYAPALNLVEGAAADADPFGTMAEALAPRAGHRRNSRRLALGLLLEELAEPSYRTAGV